MCSYHDFASVNRGLAYCYELFERIQHLYLIDVTNRSIEGVANLIGQD